MPQGQIVLYQGEASPNVYVVKSGVVRAYVILENGNEVIIAMFGPGDSFPERIAGNSIVPSMFYYDMMSDGELEVWSYEQHAKARQNETDSYEMTQRRYLGALLHINALAQQNAHDCLVHVLRYLCLRFGVPATNKSYTRINVKLTQVDLAKLSNLSRETVNQELKKLKDKNVLIVRQKYYTVNLRSLMKLIDDDIAVDLTN